MLMSLKHFISDEEKTLIQKLAMRLRQQYVGENIYLNMSAVDIANGVLSGQQLSERELSFAEMRKLTYEASLDRMSHWWDYPIVKMYRNENLDFVGTRVIHCVSNYLRARYR